MQDYWGALYSRWSQRMGLRRALSDWNQSPLTRWFQSAALSPEEQEQERKLQEAYFRDDSVRGVLITVGASLPVSLLTLLVFELTLRGVPGGLLQKLGLPRLLFSESREVAIGSRASDGTELRPAMPDPLRKQLDLHECDGKLHVNAPTPLDQKPLRRRWHVSFAHQKVAQQLRLKLAQLLRVLLTVNDSTVLQCAGMDALVMLRFCALCGRFCTLSSVWCLLLVFVCTAGGHMRESEPYRGLGLCSLSNLRPNSPALWAVVPVSYLCTLTLCGLLWKEYERFVQLRRVFLSGQLPSQTGESTLEANWNSDVPFERGLTPPTAARLQTAISPRGGASERRQEIVGPGFANECSDLLAQTRRTVLVERLPPELREPCALQARFEDLLGTGSVHSVSPVPTDAKKLSQSLRSYAVHLREGIAPDSDWDKMRGLEWHLRSRREEFQFGWTTAASRMHIRNVGSSQSLSSGLAGLGSFTAFERMDSSDGMFDGLPVPAKPAAVLGDGHSEGGSTRFSEGVSFLARATAVGCSGRDIDEHADIIHGLVSTASSPKLSWLPPPVDEAKIDLRGRSWTSHDSDVETLRHSARLKSPRRANIRALLYDSNNSEASLREAPRGEPSRSKPGRSRGERRRCLELHTAMSLGLHTALCAVRDAAAATLHVAKEIAGSSVHRVEQLMPSSALGTPAPASGIGTPFGDARRSFRMHPQKLAHLESPTGPSATAFVTMRTLQAATVACHVVLDEDPILGWQLSVEPAPEPRDLIWQNMARKRSRRLVRQFFVEAGLLVGMAFWSVPVSLIQFWCSLTKLYRLVPCLRPHLQYIRGHSYELYGILALYTPVAALLVLMEVLPVCLQWLAQHYEGVKSHSEVQMITMRRYWRFQLATIYVTVLSGSISDSLTNFVDHPATIVSELAEGLPKVAVYFLATVLSSALVVGPISLVRLPMLLRATRARVWEQMRCLLSPLVTLPEAPEPSAEAFLDSPNLAADLSALLFVLLVCVTYATVAPLMMLAGLIFFVVRWQVLAVRYLYVHVPRFDSGGAFWYLLWNQALLALFLGNLTTVAVVALKAGYGQIPFLLPTLVMPIAFKMRAEYRFLEASRRLSLTAARSLDEKDPDLSERFAPDAYWHPALRLSEAQLSHGDPWTGNSHAGLEAVEESWNLEAPTPLRGVTVEACSPEDDVYN